MGENNLLNRKFMMLVILLVSLLAISGVSAAENATDDVIGIDETDNVVNSENHVNENVEDLNDCEILSTNAENADKLSMAAEESGPEKTLTYNGMDENVLSSANKKISLKTNNVVGKCDGTIKFKVRASENGIYKSGLKIAFNCNGKDYNAVTNKNGYATLKIHLKAGSYRITTECGNALKKNTIKVNKVYVANRYKDAYVKSLTGYSNGNNIIKYGWKGNLEGYFKIYKGSQAIYKTKFNSNGYISDYFKYAAHTKQYQGSKIKNVGTYNAVITNKNGKTLAKGTVNIVKRPSNIQCNSVVTKTGAKTTLVAHVEVKDVYGGYSNANGGTVKFTINGKTYDATVNDGVARITITAPSYASTFNCKVAYQESGSIKGSSNSFQMVVNKDSPYKIITTSAKTYLISKQSGAFKVETKIWDMTAGSRAPYKYIDTTLFKNGKQVKNNQYYVNYQINGEWTGWQQYGITSTAHHRYAVYDSASVGQIQVRFNENVNSFY